jgi:hypothetical protein
MFFRHETSEGVKDTVGRSIAQQHRKAEKAKSALKGPASMKGYRAA